MQLTDPTANGVCFICLPGSLSIVHQLSDMTLSTSTFWPRDLLTMHQRGSVIPSQYTVMLVPTARDVSTYTHDHLRAAASRANPKRRYQGDTWSIRTSTSSKSEINNYITDCLRGIGTLNTVKF